jgi:DNA-binding NarL/FixJ family response regulator
MDEALLANINKNLEVVIGLLIRALPGADTTEAGDQIVMLSKMGMRPKDIAKVLGKTENTVNVTLSKNRAPKATNKKKGKR